MVNDQTEGDSRVLTCGDCAAMLQDYVDESLSRDEALRVFLHVRGCVACAAGLARWQALVQTLGQLSRQTPPADFDQRILASIPLAGYREMAPLRQPRVPVYLQESFLPSFVRAGAVRLAGIAVAAGSVGAVTLGHWPAATLLAAAAGVLPEALVRVQGLVRHLSLRVRRAEGGS